MKFRTLLFSSAALCAFASDAANASPLPGWYVGLAGGLNLVDDVGALRSHTATPSGTSAVTVNFDSGWALFATVGYGLGAGFRIEGEAGYRSNQLSIPTSSRTGDLDELSLMMNVAWDCHLSPKFTLTLGAGAGYDKAMFKDGFVDDSDWRFAYQGIVGLRYALAKRTDIALTYRHMRVSGPAFSGSHSSHSDLYTFDELGKSSLTLGFVFALHDEAGPPPVAPPPPVVVPPREFSIFFDKKCNLTREADLTLGEAAVAAQTAGPVTVRLLGDGTDAAIACRQGAVKKNLVAKGVPEAAVINANSDIIILKW